jgi:hypothetical protein
MDSSPTIQNCIFENGICMIGGAICINGGSPKIIDCVFGGNVAEFVGGAIVSEKANAVIRNCRFESNFAEYYGGALYISKGFGTLVENCVFYNNIAVGGGGIYINGDLSTRVTSCSFVENTSTVGSGIYLEGENLVVWLSLFAFGEGQALYCEPFGRVPVDIACCDIFGNKGGDWVDCIADEYGIAGNISLDPEFCGEIGTGNLTLQSDSPCRAEGNTCAYLIGAEPVNCEETSTQLTTWSRLKQLY